MKSLIVSLWISLALISCGSQSKTIPAVSYVVAKNYFVKNIVENKLFEVTITSQDEFDMPVKFIGVGEGMDDLQVFDPESFAAALFD